MKKLKKLIKIPKFFIVRLKNTDLIKNKMRGREWDSSFHSGWQKRNVIASTWKVRGNPTLTTTEKPSLRGNEVAVANSLFAIQKW